LIALLTPPSRNSYLTTWRTFTEAVVHMHCETLVKHILYSQVSCSTIHSSYIVTNSWKLFWLGNSHRTGPSSWSAWNNLPWYRWRSFYFALFCAEMWMTFPNVWSVRLCVVYQYFCYFRWQTRIR
jgi:hypothetical protein